jgi:hypothetical protein
MIAVLDASLYTAVLKLLPFDSPQSEENFSLPVPAWKQISLDFEVSQTLSFIFDNRQRRVGVSSLPVHSKKAKYPYFILTNKEAATNIPNALTSP